MDDGATPAGRGQLRLTLAVLLASACVALLFVAKLQPTSAGAHAFLACWLAAPHAAMAGLLMALQHRGSVLLPWCIAIVVVALGGLYLLTDAICWNPDAQGAIAVVLTPLLQAIAFLIAAPLAWWVGKRMRTDKP